MIASPTSRLLVACIALTTTSAILAAQARPELDGPELDLPVPTNWSHLNPQARLIAQRAARTDARHRIAERIKAIELTPGLRVRDLAVESDMLTAALHEVLRGAETMRETLRDDLPLAEATLRLPAAGVRSALVAAVSFAQSPRFASDDLRQRLDSLELSDLEAAGVGAPPRPYIRDAGSRPVGNMPEWACGAIEAFAAADTQTGDAARSSGTEPPTDGTAPPSGATASSADNPTVTAAIKAESAARERLIEAISELEPSPNASRTQLDAAAAEARVTHTRVRSDNVEVTVQLSGARLWLIVRTAANGDGSRPGARDQP